MEAEQITLDVKWHLATEVPVETHSTRDADRYNVMRKGPLRFLDAFNSQIKSVNVGDEGALTTVHANNKMTFDGLNIIRDIGTHGRFAVRRRYEDFTEVLELKVMLLLTVRLTYPEEGNFVSYFYLGRSPIRNQWWEAAAWDTDPQKDLTINWFPLPELPPRLLQRK